MLCASVLENIGGIKTPIMILGIILIFLYLRHLSKNEKKEAATEALTAETLAATEDDKLLQTVVRALFAECEAKKCEPYRMAAVWSNPEVNVYTVWAVVKEAEHCMLAGVFDSCSANLLPLAADGFGQIGATACEAAVRAALESPKDADNAAFYAAVEAEDPLALCVPYIRDNAEAFVK